VRQTQREKVLSSFALLPIADPPTLLSIPPAGYPLRPRPGPKKSSKAAEERVHPNLPSPPSLVYNSAGSSSVHLHTVRCSCGSTIEFNSIRLSSNEIAKPLGTRASGRFDPPTYQEPADGYTASHT
jgi:hypothetical protein